MADIYTGEHARIKIATKDQEALGIGSFTLTVSKAVVEQPLVGTKGPWRSGGPITIEGSLTQTKFLHSPLLDSITNGTYITISGATVASATDSTVVGPEFYFASGLVTRWELSQGDASAVMNASVDFVVVDAYNIPSAGCWISGTAT